MSDQPSPFAPAAGAEEPPEQRGQPLVSVVVRSMDRPSLSAALDSIAAQDYPHIEIVLVNALGPTHRPLPHKVGELPLRSTPVEPGRLARATAANVGLDAARGTLLAFLDDDDVYLGGHISKLVAALQAQPDAVATLTVGPEVMGVVPSSV